MLVPQVTLEAHNSQKRRSGTVHHRSGLRVHKSTALGNDSHNSSMLKTSQDESRKGSHQLI